MQRFRDRQGEPLAGADAAAARGWDALLHETTLFAGDPITGADALLARRPGFVMAHLLKAWMLLLGTDTPSVAPAARLIAAARKLPHGSREAGHIAALGHMAEGRWRAAGRAIEQLSLEHPRDLLALLAGQQLDFLTGDQRMLHERIARALPGFAPGTPGRPELLGMLAFGLEENGAYAEAEAAGRAALEAEPRNGWAQHAVAHVMEMQGRTEEGIAFMRAAPQSWSSGSFMAVHNWWHLALFHLELGQVREALELFDGPIAGGAAPLMLDLLDEAAMLWRLSLRGVELGGRWLRVAFRIAQIWQPGHSAFNDLHAVMAFLGAGWRERVAETIDAAGRRTRDPGPEAAERIAALNLMEGFRAFHEGRHGEAVSLLVAARPEAWRLGGSHAQRDVIDLTLAEAALRGGDGATARALAARRVEAKPASPFARMLARRAAQALAA